MHQEVFDAVLDRGERHACLKPPRSATPSTRRPTSGEKGTSERPSWPLSASSPLPTSGSSSCSAASRPRAEVRRLSPAQVDGCLRHRNERSPGANRRRGARTAALVALLAFGLGTGLRATNWQMLNVMPNLFSIHLEPLRIQPIGLRRARGCL